MANIIFFGDKDGLEIYIDKKINRLRTRYPEFRNFYFEDRADWGKSAYSFFDGEYGNDRFDDDWDENISPMLQELENPMTEDEFARWLIDYGYEDEK